MKNNQASLLPLLAIACLVLLLSSCARGVRWETAEALHDDAYIPALKAQVQAMFPDEFQVFHSAIVDVRGREFLMDGYVLHQPGSTRIRATNPLGGTYFDLTVAQGTVEFSELNIGLSESRLTSTVARDLSRLFSPNLSGGWELLQLPDELILEQTVDGRTRRFVFDSYSLSWTGYQEGRDAIDYELTMSAFASGDAHSVAAPALIEIRDTRQRYTATIRAAQLRRR